MEYMHFKILEEKPKTNVYSVLTNKTIIESGCLPHHITLGVILWEPRWRQYVFAPNPDQEPIFSVGCIMQIVNFLNELNKNHKLTPPSFANEKKETLK